MLQITQVLQGRYQLQKQLGNNAGRQTWLAIDLKTSPTEPVTVKLLAFSPQMQWDEFKLFEREASVLKQLNHPRIPNYRDYFSLDKQTGAGLCWFGLVQDYIPGYSLQQLLDDGKRFTEVQVRSLATQVLEILTYLHGLNPPVLHRDIKPSNLILGEDKRVYLVDFGAVQDTAAVEGVTFTVVGTTGYAPLEQFWGKAVEASDLYALGATLIHLLTGVPPADLPQRNLRIQFKEQVSIHSAFLSWIEALTEADLNLRLSTATQALEALQTGRFITSPLQPVHPPFYTKIQLSKSPTQLSIKIPGQGILFLGEIISWLTKLTLALSFVFSLLGLILVPIFMLFYAPLLLLPILWCILIVIFILIPTPLGLFLLTLFLFLWFIPFLFKIKSKKSFKKKCNFIGDELRKNFKELWQPNFSSFTSSYILFSNEKILVQHIYLKIFHFSKYGIILNDDLNVVSINNYNKLFILSNCKKYYLGKTATQSECQWLMQEIQEWLAER
jgi:serine/threonine protein kinase